MPLLVLVPGSGILLSLPVLVFLEEVESLGGPLLSVLFWHTGVTLIICKMVSVFRGDW